MRSHQANFEKVRGFANHYNWHTKVVCYTAFNGRIRALPKGSALYFTGIVRK
ncbi:MAG: hypothetical protein V1753_04990 [Pseudomonadota bacterium]